MEAQETMGEGQALGEERQTEREGKKQMLEVEQTKEVRKTLGRSQGLIHKSILLMQICLNPEN